MGYLTQPIHEYGAVILWHACRWMTGGRALFPSAGSTLQELLPEGCRAGDDDVRGVVRAADAERTLGLRNTDVKVISATLNTAFSAMVRQTISSAQRGLTAGRQFSSNILELG
eukprot:9143056-Pyramimonas_sp.AAC.1